MAAPDSLVMVATYPATALVPNLARCAGVYRPQLTVMILSAGLVLVAGLLVVGLLVLGLLVLGLLVLAAVPHPASAAMLATRIIVPLIPLMMTNLRTMR